MADLQTPPEGDMTTPKQTVNLHFVSPSREITNGHLDLVNIDLDVEIGTLQLQISQQLQNDTPPERLRLIYHGRALSDPKAKLRSYLHRELEASSTLGTITIHLVVTPLPAAPNPLVGGAPPRGLPVPPMMQTQQRMPSPGVAGVPNPQLQPHVHHHHHVGHNAPGQGPPQPGAFQNYFQQIQNQIQSLQQAQQNMGANQQGHPPHFNNPHPNVPGAAPALHGLPSFQSIIAQQQQQRAMGGMPGMGFQGPIQNGIGPGLQGPQNTLPHASGVPHRQTSVQEMLGPNGQRMRVTTAVESVIISRSSTPQPTAMHTSHSNNGANNGESQRSDSQTPTPTRPTSTTPHLHSTGGPPLSNLPTITPVMPFLSQLAQLRPIPPLPHASTSSIATAFLLSSPTGPQAILFSPEHGLFTSQPQPTPTQPVSRGSVATTSSTARPGSSGIQARVTNTRPPQVQVQAQAQPAGVVIRRRIEIQQNQDLLALALARIWLFVRLYLFALMFTDPNSWFRWVFLSGSVLYCLSPPNNFFQEQFRRLQGHIEGLVPLAAPANARPAQNNRDERGIDQNARDGQPRRRRNREPDPHEAAQRLLQQQQAQRGNSWLMETSRWLERSIALFVASLVPGVGERHIRARNEAEAARQAAERAEREAEEEANREESAADPSNNPEQVEHEVDGQAAPNPDHEPQQAAQEAPPPIIQV